MSDAFALEDKNCFLFAFLRLCVRLFSGQVLSLHVLHDSAVVTKTEGIF